MTDQSPKGQLIYPAAWLHSFMIAVFTGVGVPAGDAQICSDVLLASDLRGIESHGLSRLKMYIDRIRDGRQNPVTRLDTLRESPGTALLDGNNGMGPVIAYRSMALAIQKARTTGTGTVAVRNSTHFGIAGYYPLMAVREGMIGLCVTNTRPSMAPTFGVQPLLGTNPIAFGAPTDEDIPFLFDGATPIIQRGKVEIHARKKIPLPDGYVIDQQGQPATDPALILQRLSSDENAFLPLGGAGEDFGGHKGYGLATMVEILSACLQGGPFLAGLTGFSPEGVKQPFRLGHYFQAVAIEAFTTLDEFKHSTGTILRTLRASRKAAGQTRIFTAGEKEEEAQLRNQRDGIPISLDLARELDGLARELSLDEYRFS